MKVGKGFFGPMSNNSKKCISHGNRPVLYTAALIVLAFSLALAGCGDISLGLLLSKQAPGELGIIPQMATISADTSIEISGKGGFTPYTFSANYGSIEEIDGVTYYKASATSAEITIVDALSNQATAIINVETPTNPFTFPEAMTIAVGESTGYIQASDGDISVTGKYTFELIGDGTIALHPSTPEYRVKYVAPAYVPSDPDIFVLATDDIGQVSTLKITVVAATGG